MLRKWLGVCFVVLLGYLLFAPVPVTPVAWNAPENPGFTGQYTANDRLAALTPIGIGDESGPEDLAVDSKGNVYASVHSGAILRLLQGDSVFRPWVHTQGRPLGIEMDAHDRLWVADAMLGLLRIEPDGTVIKITDSVEGSAIGYADDVDIAPDGMVYFSDASTKFPASAHGGTLQASLLDLMEHGGHGRLLSYDPVTRDTNVLLRGLQFANGIALSGDGQYVMINETGSYQVLKLWLQGPLAGTSEVIIDNLPGFPDNIARAADGHFWLGLASPRSAALDALSDYPGLRKVVQRLPAFLRPKAQHYGHVIKLSGEGQVLLSLQDPAGKIPMTTGAIELEEQLLVSSLTANHVGMMVKPRM